MGTAVVHRVQVLAAAMLPAFLWGIIPHVGEPISDQLGYIDRIHVLILLLPSSILRQLKGDITP